MIRYALVLGLYLLFSFTQAHAFGATLTLAEVPEYTEQAGRAELRFKLSARVDAVPDITPFVEVRQAGASVSAGIRVEQSTLMVSALQAGQSYQVRLRKGFPLVSGPLAQPIEVTATTASMRPGLQFVGDTSLLIVPSDQPPKIAFKATQYPAMSVQIDTILPSVALRLLQTSMLSDDPYLSSDSLKAGANTIHPLSLDAQGIANGRLDLANLAWPRGSAYRVRIQGCASVTCEKRGLSDSAVVLPSRFAISLVRDAEHAWVSLRDFETGQLQQGGQVTLHARNSDVLGVFDIQPDGYARVPTALMQGEGGQRPGLLVSQAGGGLSYLSMHESELTLAALPVQGVQPSDLGMGYLRTERGVYRAGELVHFAAIARGVKMEPMSGQAMVLRVIRPDSKVWVELPVKADSNGVLSHSVTLGAGAKRGGYRAELIVGDNVIAQTRFQVQDFVPETMQIQVDSLAPFVSIGEPLSVSTQSDFLFGAPAAARPITAQLRAYPTRTPFATFKDYQFGGLNTQDWVGSLLDAQEQISSDSGAATFEFSRSALSQLADSTVPQRLKLSLELSELSGRMTRQSAQTMLATQPRWVGLQPKAQQSSYQPGAAPVMSMVLVDALSGQAKAGQVRWRLVQEDWDYYWTRQGGRWNWRVEYFERSAMASGVLDLGENPEALRLPKLDYGRYKLQVWPVVGQPTEHRFSVGWWGTGGESAAVPDTLDVAVSNANPQPGERLTVTIRAPFDGTAEVWLVDRGVRAVYQTELTERSGKVTLQLPQDLAQAYVLVKGYRAASASQPGPARAVGAVHLQVGIDRYLKSAEVSAPDHVRPNSEIPVSIQIPGSQEGASVVVSMVDLGILNLTAHPTARPFDWFTRKQALGVSLMDPYGFVARLLASIQGNDLAVGGDEAGSESTSSGTFFETIAMQTPPLTVRDGQVQVQIPVGELNGRVRIDVMGSDGASSIQGSAEVIVRDPIAVSSMVPRVAAVDDRFLAGVGLTATQLIQGPVTLHWSVDGSDQDSVMALTQFRQEIPTLSVGQSVIRQVPVQVTANGVGTLMLRIESPGLPEQVYHWPIRVREAGSLTQIQRQFSVAGGAAASLPTQLLAKLESPVPSLSVARLPVPDIQAALAGLSRYPYGCLEQTVSKAFPLNVLTQSQASAGGWTQARARLARSYQRIADLQRSSGQFSLWSSSSTAEQWLSLYAVDFLARPISEGALTGDAYEAAERIRLQTLRDAQPILARLARAEDADVKAYALLLLAQAGQPDVGEMRYLLSGNELDPTSAAQLGYAFSLLGDSERAQQAFDRASALGSGPSDYATYSSPIRDLAARAYYAALSQQWEHAESALTQLQSQVAEKKGLSTQERAWVVRAVLAADSVAGVSASAWRISDATLQRSEQFVNESEDRLHVTYSVLGYRLADTDSQSIQSGFQRWWTGQSQDSPVNASQDFLVLDSKLQPKASYPQGTAEIELQQGDRLLMAGQVNVKQKGQVGEWLFEQKAAGGLEVENPALGGLDAREVLRQLGVTRPLTQPNHQVYLDDRMAEVSYLRSGQEGREAQTISLWQAVIPGEYRLPGLHVENMLNPSLSAATAEVKIRVLAR